MWIAYLIALIPLIAGGILWVKNGKISTWEWIGGSAVGFLTAFIFNIMAVNGMTSDIETWSGQITEAIHYPEWVESYQVAVYKTVTDSKGNSKQVFSHYETHYQTHQEHWECTTSVDETFSIDESFYEQICVNFKSRERRHEHKSGFYSGDHNVYFSINKTGFVYPVNVFKTFENKVKVSPSLFSFAKVPKNVAYEYPKNENWLTSDRLIGPVNISVIAWDRLNARLGASKKVNLILINFENQGSDIAHLQEAKWIGGKKNDLVLCYGEGWSYVFGWTESELVKRNLETLLLNNKVEEALIPAIEKEVRANYELKDWSKFSYLSVSPPPWSYWVLILVMLLTQGGLYYWFSVNEYDKDGKSSPYFGSKWVDGPRTFGGPRW